VFAAGTVKVTAGDTVNFGIESAKFAANPTATSDQQANLGAATEVQWGYLVKYDTDGRVLWARKIGGGAALSVYITSVTAMGDKVYVSGWAPSDIAVGKVDSCSFETSMGKGAGISDDFSNNFLCSGGYLTVIPASQFVIAYDASGLVSWVKTFARTAPAATAAWGWGGNSILASVSAVRGARPLTGNTAGWNSLETLLGRDQPPMGEINDNGSENNDKSISKGRFVYLTGSLTGHASTPEKITVTGVVFPVINAGAAVTLTGDGSVHMKTYLIKLDAQTGQTQWAQTYPPTVSATATHHVVPSDLKVDDITGAVYMVGTITAHAAFGNADACNLNGATSQCGADLFGLGNNRRVGCPVDPRPYLGSPGRCQASGTLSTDPCTAGVLNKEFGLPYCRFVPVGYGALSTTGFIAKISDGYTDQYRRTLNDNFGPGQSADAASADAVRSNVQWFKVLGNGHGHIYAGTSGGIKTEGHSVSIRNSDVIVAGLYTVPSKDDSNARLQFPGVHTLIQNEPITAGVQQPVTGGRQTIYGTAIGSLGLLDGIVSSTTSEQKGAFVAVLKD
jgi:hypothetical protein